MEPKPVQLKYKPRYEPSKPTCTDFTAMPGDPDLRVIIPGGKGLKVYYCVWHDSCMNKRDVCREVVEAGQE